MMRDDAVYRGYSPGELERLYSHRHRIEGYDDYLERWPRESATARERLTTVADVAYGSRAAESYDVFPAGPDAPVLVFFHGGYWFSQDKGNFEFMAPAFVARGTTFVSANYPLCPEVTLPEIVDACRRCMMHVRDNAQDVGRRPRTGVRVRPFGGRSHHGLRDVDTVDEPATRNSGGSRQGRRRDQRRL